MNDQIGRLAESPVPDIELTWRSWREAEVVKVAENVSPRLGIRRRSSEKSRPRGRCPVLILPSDFLRCRPEAAAGLHLSIFDNLLYPTNR